MKNIAVIFFVLIVGCLSAKESAAGMIALRSPLDGTTNVAGLNQVVGDQFGLDVWMDFTNDKTLGGGVDISWNPSILSLNSWTFYSVPGSDVAMTNGGTIASNNITGIAFGNFNGLTGPAKFGTLMFDVIDIGQTLIDLAVNTGNYGSFYSALTLEPQNITFVDTAVNATAPVPVPGAVWLLGSGLLGLVGLRRKFRN